MAAGQPIVKIHGLKEMVRGLKGADRQVWRALRAEFKGVGDWMAGIASSNAQAHPAAAKTLAPTFKGKGDRYGAQVKLGGRGGPGKAYRAGAGWEYGSQDPGDQFHNPYITAKGGGAIDGHYLGKAIRDNRGELENRAIGAVKSFWHDDLARMTKF